MPFFKRKPKKTSESTGSTANEAPVTDTKSTDQRQINDLLRGDYDGPWDNDWLGPR